MNHFPPKQLKQRLVPIQIWSHCSPTYTVCTPHTTNTLYGARAMSMSDNQPLIRWSKTERGLQRWSCVLTKEVFRNTRPLVTQATYTTTPHIYIYMTKIKQRSTKLKFTEECEILWNSQILCKSGIHTSQCIYSVYWCVQNICHFWLQLQEILQNNKLIFTDNAQWNFSQNDIL